MLRTSSLVLLGALAALVGCSDPPAATPDSGMTPTDGGGTGDIGTDASTRDSGRAPRSPQGLYGQCINDAECGEGLTCMTEAATGFPGGYCNRDCTTADDCVRFEDGVPPIDGYCRPADANGRRSCARVCANGQDCERDGYTCVRLNASSQLAAINVCVPVCTPASCIDGTTCDANSGRCVATGSTPTGRSVGETCLATTDMTSTPATRCRSELCNPEMTLDSRGVPFYTGFNGGQCVARCILPQGYNPSTLWDDTRLPQANCPSGAICFPNGSLARGDLGTCLDECMSDSDCRADQGYFCRKTVQLSTTNTRRFENGWCTPINCLNTMTPCPSGYRCDRRQSGTTVVGACIPAAADAGVAPSDAGSTSDAGSSDVGAPADGGA